MTPEEIAVLLCAPAPQGPLHSRVEPVFLPLGIRRHRVEDVFLLFLKWLGRGPERVVDRPAGFHQSPTGIAELVMAGVQGHPTKFSPIRGDQKAGLARSWIRAELVVEPQQSNRTGKAAVRPLHVAVADCFEVPDPSPPAYGRFLCELLSRRSETGSDFTLLDELESFFSEAGLDFVAKLLEGSLWTDAVPSGSPKYMELQLPSFKRQVWSLEHARRFQARVSTLLGYREAVSRRVLLEWLYSIITFYMSTYFLRMALIADAYHLHLEAIVRGESPQWCDDCFDSEDFAPRIPYGRQDETHARLMKQFPASTSQVNIVREFCRLSTNADPPTDIAELAYTFKQLSDDGTVMRVFEVAAREYPTSAQGSSFRLSMEDKQGILDFTTASHMTPFQTFSRLLNFEDMARSSNNIVEWYFYSTLAKSPEFGFAAPNTKGDNLTYRLSTGLLLALLHCHCASSESEPTLASFIRDLELSGFVFDSEGRLLLEKQLVQLGLLEALADASDAKRLVPLYEP